MDAISELLKRISHEYNNLFGIVIAALGILEDDLEEHPGFAQLKPLIRDALSASREGTELMDRLLTCTGHHSLEPENVELTMLLAAFEDRFESTLPGDIEMEIAVEPQLPEAYVDPVAFGKAILSLAENAREAMPNGGKLRIAAGLHSPGESSHGGAEPIQPGRYLSVSVSDTGGGIAPELLNRVFEPFVTTKEPAKSRGFGLSTSYGFARQSEGWLLLNSVPGRGTTVTLVIPTATPNKE